MKIITIFWTDDRENHRQAKQFTDREEADKYEDKKCYFKTRFGIKRKK